MKAQTIQVDSTFTADGEIFPFSPNDTIYGLSISGSVTLLSDTSIVRVILIDDSGNEWMVFEAYPMIVNELEFEIEEECDETCYLNEITPSSIQIQIYDAVIIMDSIYVNTEYVPNIESLIIENRVYQEDRKALAINQFIESNNLPWVAGTSSDFLSTYQEKASMFGDKYNLLGYDYYMGGIFIPLPAESYNKDNSLLVQKFDWREQHNAHNSGSPYFDYDPDEAVRCGTFYPEYFPEHGNGWMTKVEDQNPYEPPDCGNGCDNCCYIFASLGVMEAITNLYYNYHYDLDLSEQDALNCSSPSNDCDGGNSLHVFNMAVDDEQEPNEGIIDEPSLAWADGKQVCNKEIDFQYRLTFEDNVHHGHIYYEPPAEEIKLNLLQHGPMQISIDLPGSGLNHDLVLVGYGVLEEGDIFHSSNGVTFNIDDYPLFIGSQYWICKNSYSPWAGDQGYFYLINNSVNDYYYQIYYYTYIVPPIYLENNNPEIDYVRHCYDHDNDGYYNWGIGDLPEGWEHPCGQEFQLPELQDWNDDDNRIGPRDDNFNGIPVAPEMKVYMKRSIAKDYIVNNSFFSFSADDIDEDNKVTIYIGNTGDAQLNLRPFGISGERPVEIIEVEGASSNFWIEDNDQPQIKVCMESENVFQVTFTGQEQGELTKIKIYLDEDCEFPDFEFVLVYNDCVPATELETITVDETWSNFELKNKDYLISQGVTVTITGEIAMAENSDIFIQNGGELIIDGGRLTASCDGLWNGIDVWGDWRHPQLVESQGTVRVKNGGTIEYARCGIENKIWYGDMSVFTGGIFDVEEALFKDNLIGIRFWPYHNYNPGTGLPIDNCSRIKTSEFKTTQHLYDLGYDPTCFISMTEVEGVKILACNFQNEVESYELAEGEEPGIGIFSTEAGYIIDHYCTEPQIPCLGYTPCRFENLEYGIKTSFIRPVESVSVTNSEFINNKTGIYLGACAFPTVNQNIFHVRKADPASFNEAIYCGLYLDNCTGYDVEENFFYTFLDEQEKEDLVSVGLVVNNSGPEDNDIYNNNFDRLYSGLIAQEVNRNEEGDLGLQIKCNSFINGIYDIAVTKDPQGVGIKGIAKDQGSSDPEPNAPAGNRFSYTWNNEESDYFNECEDIKYYHHIYSAEYNLTPVEFSENFVKPEENEISFYIQESCPSNLNSGGPGILEEKSNMMIAGQKADSLQNLISLLTDGGDTEGLLTDIQTSWPEDAYELYSGLIAESPYLSDTSLIKAVEKEDVLLPGMITDVLVANPQSAKSEEIMSTVDERINPLTDDQLADIGEGRFIIGAKEALESDYSFYLTLKDRSKNNLIRLYKADTLSDSPIDSIIDILSLQSNLSDEYLKTFEYLKKGDSINAINTLADLPLNYNLTVSQTNEHALYEDYFEILFSLDTAGSAIFRIDSTQKAMLNNIMTNSPGILKAFARNILIINDSLDHTEPIFLPQPGLKSGKVRIWPEKRIQKQNFMKIYPNPAKNLVIIEVRLKDEPKDAIVKIIDNRGVILKSYSIEKHFDYLVIPLSDFPSGNVFCQLNIQSKNVETKKLVILK